MRHGATLCRGMAVATGGSRSRSCSTQGLLLQHRDEEEGEGKGDLFGKALQGLAELEQVGHSPPDHVYISLLKACHTRKALAHTKQVFEHLKRHRSHQLTGVLGDYLVISMVKCGSLQDALHVFNRTIQHSVYAWTALISGFTESGQGQDALKLQKHMEEEQVEPNQYTFVSLLKACGSVPCLDEGHALHMKVVKKGWGCDIFIASSLVPMYGKCGSLEEAEHVFLNLSERNVVTWNGMLSAYVQQEQGEKALRLYRQMIEEVVCPNDTTYAIALQACVVLANKEEPIITNASWLKLISFSIGQALHAVAHKNGFTENIGCSLVRLYGKCLNVQEAENAFFALSLHKLNALNSMISAYVDNGQGQLALQLFCHMQQIGVIPDAWTFVSAIHACGIVAEGEESIRHMNENLCSDIGQALHNDVERMGFESHVFVGNTLLTMYSKIGTIVKAESVFAGLRYSNLVSWNAMLSAYVDQRHEEKALQLFRQMLEENKKPNDQTFTIAIHACSSLAVKEEVSGEKDIKLIALKIGQALHADALRKGIASNVYVGNTLISMYSKCGRVADSEHAFQGLFSRNIISWNAMLSAYVENGHDEKALKLFLQMLEKGVSASKPTFRTILHACVSLVEKIDPMSGQRQSSLSKVGTSEIVKALHADAERMGFTADPSVVTIFMSVYSKCEMVADASFLFGMLCQKHVISCNVMLSIYVEHGLGEKALHLYRKMLSNYGSDEVTLVYVLQACSDLGHVRNSRELHFALTSSGHDLNPLVSTTLIHTYGYCAAMVDAETVFDSLFELDVVSWSACLAGYAREGNYSASLRCFLEMKVGGVQPNRVAFLSLLHSCSHTGLVCKGLEYFESMSRDFVIRPDLKCYAGVIDLLGRAGDFKRLKNVLSRFPVQDDLPIWLCLLSVCCIHGNRELGAHAFDYAVSLQPEDTASYLLTANMLAYDEVLDPAELLQDMGKPASSEDDTSYVQRGSFLCG